MAEEEKDRKFSSFVGCPEHSHTVERVAILEKGMGTVEKGMNNAVSRIEQVRDLMTKEFGIIRQNIIEGIKERYTVGVIWVVSILTGLCTALITALLMKT